MRRPLFFRHLSLLLVLPLLLTCAEAEQLVDKYPVRYVVQNPSNVEVLNAALNGMGEFCTVVDKGTRVECTNLKGNMSPINKLATDRYGSFNFGRSNGFIVGRTNMIASRFPNQVVCYDIVCYNCYNNLGDPRNVELITGARAQCPKCQCIYDLNELGIASEGHSLYRYPVRYSSSLVIGN